MASGKVSKARKLALADQYNLTALAVRFSELFQLVVGAFVVVAYSGRNEKSISGERRR